MATKRLSAVLEFGGKVSSSFKNAVGATTKRIDKIGKAITETTKDQASLRREIKKLQRAGKPYDDLTQKLNTMGRSVARLEKRQKRLRRINRLVAGSFKRIGQLGKSVFRGIGIAAAGGVALIGKLLLSTAAYGDELAKTAKRQGLTVEGLEKMRFIAERSGVENKVLEKSIQQVQVSIGEAARNIKGPYAEAFKSLGINFKKFDKLDPVEQTKALADAFKNVTSQSERTSLAYRLFGGRGTKMLQILVEGREGIDEMGDAFDRLGGTIGEKGAKSAVKFSDTLTDLKKQVGTTFRLIALEAMPTVTKAMKSLTESMRNGDIDVKAIGQSIGTMIVLMGKAAKGALQLGGAIVDLGKKFFGSDYTTPEGEETPQQTAERLTRERKQTRASSVTNNTTFNIMQQPGEDPNVFARRVEAARKRQADRDEAASMSGALAN